jgi:hypothetical protein
MNTLHPKSRPRTSAAFTLGPPHPQEMADGPADLNADFEWPSDAYPDPAAGQSLCPRAEAIKRGAYLVGMLALFLGFLVLLSGCGPGTGGTGVGPTPIAGGPTSSSALANAPNSPSTLAFSGSFTSAVGSPATPPSLPAPTTGAAPAPTSPAATASSTSVLTLLLEPERVLLSSACLSFASLAPLPAAASDGTSTERVLPGVFEQTRKVQGQTSRTSVPASLVLRFAETPLTPLTPSSSPSVRLSIQDSSGKLLLGPVDLQRLSSVPVQGEVPASVDGCLG